MGNSKSSGRAGVVTFRFDGSVYVLRSGVGVSGCNRDDIVYFSSRRMAKAAVSKARKRLLSSGGMMALMADLLFDFRIHEVSRDAFGESVIRMGGGRSGVMGCGYINGLRMPAKTATAFHMSGDEACPRFKIRRKNAVEGSHGKRMHA